MTTKAHIGYCHALYTNHQLLAKMPELGEAEKRSQSSETSPPSSVVYEKTSSPNDSVTDEENSGSCQNSPLSSCTEEFTAKTQLSTEADHEEAEFGDDKLE